MRRGTCFSGESPNVYALTGGNGSHCGRDRRSFYRIPFIPFPSPAAPANAGARDAGTGHIRFGPALAVCAAGAGAHLILDLTNVYGLKLLWPFAQRWYAWDLAASIDPLLLILLAGGLLLPLVFRLVGEEIGARTRRESQWPAFVLLAMVALYFGVRVVSHARVLAVVNSRSMPGRSPASRRTA